MRVFTNGCFSLGIHAGHARMLETCSRLAGPGGRVIVALNSDASIDRLKPGIIHFPLDQRKQILRAVRWVDEVLDFDTEADLEALLQVLRPAILAKGAEYDGHTLTGSQFAGKVVLVPRLVEVSTSQVVRQLNAR